MATVVVAIAGRTYRMSCNDGEEAQLERLAGVVEKKILEMKESFGEIGEQRIVVMAALALADETYDAREKAATAVGELDALRAERDAAREALAALEARAAAALEDAARRVRLASEALAGDETPPPELL
jgi:cell division protein ZapA